jgi:hypothetical protein
MEDEVDHDELLELVTYRIYETLSELHLALIDQVGQDTADQLLINAMSANIGNVIGQLDVKKQRRYATLARDAIREHMLIGTMQKGLHAHGQIGHA